MSEEAASASAWFNTLRDRICAAFEAIEDELSDSERPAGRFTRRSWQRDEQPGGGIRAGGGVSSVMRGRVFEKVGVNVSTVSGEFPEAFAKQMPGTEHSRAFQATGISLVAHMNSPRVPAVHMNTRFISTGRSWFGGGADLNPALPFENDTADFHAAFSDCCNRHDPQYYPRFKAWCDEYFWLKHRNESRGVGGIFYDYLYADETPFDALLAFTRDVGETFLSIFPQLVRLRMHEAFTAEEKETQLVKRGRYAEFNLLYDRGTVFGLQTGGDTEAILMSLPPEAKWP